MEPALCLGLAREEGNIPTGGEKQSECERDGSSGLVGEPERRRDWRGRSRGQRGERLAWPMGAGPRP